MLRYITLLTAILVVSNLRLNAQDTLIGYQSKAFKSLDVNVGLGFYAPLYSPIPLTFVYQQNIKPGFSFLVFSQLGIMSKTDMYLNMTYKMVNWIEGGGIGTSVGNTIFNIGFHAIVGGRFYFSEYRAINSELYHNPIVITRKLMPELGVLLNMKVGKKKIYFSSQLYASLYPFKNILENFHNYSIGIGYKF
ncbi:MAG: hypothetical protein PHI52_06975 [Bacteroidales bacterium]|nr:hypothetical protein [Bacteroidales bacterium]